MAGVGEALRGTVEEADDRRNVIVVVELEHIGAGGERLAVDDYLPLHPNPAMMRLRLGAGPEYVTGRVLGELIPEADQLVDSVHDTDRRVVADIVRECRRGKALPFIRVRHVPETYVPVGDVRLGHGSIPSTERFGTARHRCGDVHSAGRADRSQ